MAVNALCAIVRSIFSFLFFFRLLLLLLLLPRTYLALINGRLGVLIMGLYCNEGLSSRKTLWLSRSSRREKDRATTTTRRIMRLPGVYKRTREKLSNEITNLSPTLSFCLIECATIYSSVLLVFFSLSFFSR